MTRKKKLPHTHLGASTKSLIDYDRKRKAGWKMEYADSVEAAIRNAGLP